MENKKKLNRETAGLPANLPVKVIQFGEGNFLRAFVDYAFDVLNREKGTEYGVAVVQPIERGMLSMLEDQDGLYTLFLQGISRGEAKREKVLIPNIVRMVNPYSDFEAYLSLARLESLEFVISNTTEAGISFDPGDKVAMEPPNSFPGKLTRFLYERYRHFKGAKAGGLTIIPCELINYNAAALQEIIHQYIELWSLEAAFGEWVSGCCDFHNTLVDRIVPGYPRDNREEYDAELEYEDNLIVCAETYFLWVIEGDEQLRRKLPLEEAGLNVRIVRDMQPYRTRKVRILNGAHTAMVPFALLYGNETVKETVDNSFTGKFVHELIFREIVPVLDLDRKELEEFAGDVLDRFRNPYIEHLLSSIALNSVSKFRVRVLPSILEYIGQQNELPVRLVFAFACLIRFYKGEWNEDQLPVNDSAEVTVFMENAWKAGSMEKVAGTVLGNKAFWEEDLNNIPMLHKAITLALEKIESDGVEKGYLSYAGEMKSVNKKMADHV